jgi:hypothetical protein
LAEVHDSGVLQRELLLDGSRRLPAVATTCFTVC